MLIDEMFQNRGPVFPTMHFREVDLPQYYPVPSIILDRISHSLYNTCTVWNPDWGLAFFRGNNMIGLYPWQRDFLSRSAEDIINLSYLPFHQRQAGTTTAIILGILLNFKDTLTSDELTFWVHAEMSKLHLSSGVEYQKFFIRALINMNIRLRECEIYPREIDKSLPRHH